MPTKVQVQTQINGEEIEFLCEPRQSVLEVLRDVLGLTGSKEGCNNGNCGACSVLIDGVLVNSCCVLGVEVSGREVTTIEGIATPAGLHPLQQKFWELHGLQCGFCTPGILLTAEALLNEIPDPSDDEIRLGRLDRQPVAEVDAAAKTTITQLHAQRRHPLGHHIVE